VEASRKIPDLKKEFALAAIKRGLRKGGPGTLRYEPHMKKMTTLREFVAFAEGYIRAEYDNRSPKRPRSRSPRMKEETWQPKANQPKGQSSSRKANRPQQDGANRDSKEEYRPWFDRYAPFTKPRYEMYQIVKDVFDLPAPLRKEIFEVKNLSKKCMFHGFEGHLTGECLQLKDILEKLARQGKLTDYIKPEFYEKWKWQYNGRSQEFRKDIPYKRNQNRDR
jgi:hypothetical protein